MRPLFTTALVLLATAVSVPASAGPPALHPVGIETVYGFAESARFIHRQLGPKTSLGPLGFKTIVLDPGHGGEQEGAVGVAKVQEKQLTLELAYELREAIERRHPDVRVVLTRYWDREVDLYERTRWANHIDADLFISLHYNAAPHDKAIGFETYFLSEDVIAETAEPGDRRKQKGTPPQKGAWRALDRARVKAAKTARAPMLPPHERSKTFAALVQQELGQRIESTNRGVKHANFAVLRGAMMPAIVVESGFLTHPVEGEAVLTQSHRQLVVQSIVRAIERLDADGRPSKGEAAPVAQHLRVQNP